MVFWGGIFYHGTKYHGKIHFTTVRSTTVKYTDPKYDGINTMLILVWYFSSRGKHSKDSQPRIDRGSGTISGVNNL